MNVLISDTTSQLGSALAAAFRSAGAQLTDRDVDVLVNVSDPTQDYRAAFEADVFRPLELMQSVLPGMIQRRSGTVINICSTNPAHASKFALEGMSRSARIEWHRHNIRVLIVQHDFSTPAGVAAEKIVAKVA